MNRLALPVRAVGWLVALALVFAATPLLEAQAAGTITGTVRSAVTNQPLPGVQVVVRGTQRGSLTDTEGRFVVPNVAAGPQTVDASLIGFQRGSETVAVVGGQGVQVAFLLQQSAVAIEGIVVTGTGTPVARRRLSAPVDVLSGAAIDEAAATNIGQLLQGRVPGAVVQSISAQPGQAPRINFRGVSSVFASQTPVIYVDGVRMDNRTGMGWGTGGEVTSALAEILASDIDRIEITKGGAASTLYGSEAANGVIQIFTRRGIGAPRLTVRVEQGLDQPEAKFIQDAGFAYPDLADEPGFNPNFVRDRFLRTGWAQDYYVGASGGGDLTSYHLSSRVSHAQGVLPENDGAIYALRGHLSTRLREPLTVDFTGNFTRNNFSRIFNGWAINDPLTAFEVGDALFLSGAPTLEEALDVLLMPDIDEQVSRFTFGTTATFSPSDLFTSRATVGVDYRANEQRLIEPIDFPVTTDAGSISRYNRDFTSVTLDFAGTFSYPREGRITSDLTLGVQGFREEESQIFATGTNFSLPGNLNFDAAADVSAYERNAQIFNGGFFVLERIGLRDVLFLEAGVRFDGNSAFGRGVGLQSYPKAGIAYNISDELFWLDGRLGQWVPELKLRAAYGQTGRYPPPFERDAAFTAAPFRGESAPRFVNPGNPELGPERVTSLDLGFDLGAWQNRFGVNLTWFNARTDDALFQVREQPVTGQLSQLRNVGELLNRGIELSVNVAAVRRPTLGWNVGAMLNTVHNEVLSLGGEESFFIGAQDSGIVQIGYPVGAYYVNQPVDTTGDGLPDGVARDFVFHPDTGRPLGPTPTRTGSFFTDLRTGNFSFSALADWSAGSAVLDFGTAWATFNALERVVFPERYNAAGGLVRRYTYTEAFNTLLMRGDFWKLRELGVRYHVPVGTTRRWGAERTTIYGTVRNAYTWVPRNQALFAEEARRNLLDPELAGIADAVAPLGGELQLGGAQSITLPPPRQFRLGVQVGL
jgi:TonB-dependent starch-binding outer membrane protein SusC